MKKYNWKYLRKGKSIIFGLCVGDELKNEYSDMATAYHREKDYNHVFENSIDDFMEKQKRIIAIKQSGGEPSEVLEDEGYIKFINRQKKLYGYDPNGEQLLIDDLKR